MKCDRCGSTRVEVADSRYYPKYDYRRRRFYCPDCDSKWTRYEVSEETFFRLKQIESRITGEKTWWSIKQNAKDKKAAKKAELEQIRRNSRGK